MRCIMAATQPARARKMRLGIALRRIYNMYPKGNRKA
jgi:hypothetical protein